MEFKPSLDNTSTRNAIRNALRTGGVLSRDIELKNRQIEHVMRKINTIEKKKVELKQALGFKLKFINNNYGRTPEEELRMNDRAEIIGQQLNILNSEELDKKKKLKKLIEYAMLEQREELLLIETSIPLVLNERSQGGRAREAVKDWHSLTSTCHPSIDGWFLTKSY